MGCISTPLFSPLFRVMLASVHKHFTFFKNVGGPVPKDIYQRIKKLEDKILELEGMSPEYFQSAVSSAAFLVPRWNILKRPVNDCSKEMPLLWEQCGCAWSHPNPRDCPVHFRGGAHDAASSTEVSQATVAWRGSGNTAALQGLDVEMAG